LATLRDGTRDGTLVVVGRDGRAFARARARGAHTGGIAPTLQYALDDWAHAAPALARLAETAAEALDTTQLGPPLPRAYEWIDGSAYLNHVRLARRARGAEPPATLETDPLVYQGGSGALLGPRDDIPLADPEHGLDFEAEVAVILGDVPRGVRAADAHRFVRLVVLANDVTLRNLVPGELAKGFGFFQSKPATAFSPFAVTPDELGDSWHDGRVHLPLRTIYNGTVVGNVDAGAEMHFSFFDLIAHVARTRALTAGTILGAGTASSSDRACGVSCLAERRAIEIIESGAATTPFMTAGDHVAIDMRDDEGRDIFGRIEQKVVAA